MRKRWTRLETGNGNTACKVCQWLRVLVYSHHRCKHKDKYDVSCYGQRLKASRRTCVVRLSAMQFDSQHKHGLVTIKWMGQIWALSSCFNPLLITHIACDIQIATFDLFFWSVIRLVIIDFHLNLSYSGFSHFSCWHLWIPMPSHLAHATDHAVCRTQQYGGGGRIIGWSYS